MADSKQATPDDKQNDIALFSAEHDFGNAKYFYAARTAIAELKRLLASRSGPEQATPECTCGDIYGGFPAGEPEPNQLDSTCPVHGNKLASRSGPDRTLSAKEFFRNDPRFRNTNTEPYTDVELAHVNTSINGTDVFEFAEAYASQAGPDRPEAVAPAPEQPADAKALMEICATCGHLRDSHIKLTRDGELRGACTVCNKCDSFVEPAQTTPGNVMYSCGHVAHDPNAPQDANWKAETACPDCSGPSEERARELTGVSQEAAKVDAFAVNQRIGHLFSEIRRHAGRTNFDEEDICELLRPYVEAKCQIESADLAAPSSEREDSSGPDRTTQEPREWLIAKRGAAGQWINKNTDAPIMWTHDEVLAYLAEAGPDRGQQDAPEISRGESRMRYEEELADALHISFCSEYVCEGTPWEVPTDREPQYFATLKEAIVFLVNLLEPEMAKAAREGQCPYCKNGDPLGTAEGHPSEHYLIGDEPRYVPCLNVREGQAPKGDRIKVEREPGCKCEYAIWTNARGCPLHDVPGKASDSEKQG